jgi:type IV pilus assembly protein PilB
MSRFFHIPGSEPPAATRPEPAVPARDTAPSPVRRPPSDHLRLGDLLVQAGTATRDAVERAAATSHAQARRLGEALIDAGDAEELEVYRALAAQWGMPLATIEELVRQLDAEVMDILPRAYLERHACIPLSRTNEEIVVATPDPTTNLDDLAKALQAHRARAFLVTPTDYRRLWMLGDVRRGRVVTEEPPRPGGRDPLDLLTQDPKGTLAHSIALFEALLLEAIAERASDIHLERYGDDVRVRLRVDGDLRDFRRIRIGSGDLVGLVNVIKVSASLDIAERRLPQGGRIRRKAGGKAYDLRVQTQPSLYGEHVVIRLLPQDTKVLAIEDLGFPSALAIEYRRLLDSPGGLVLVVGPTGSGKTTTLYGGLQHIARDPTRKIITAEDPIEYAIWGVQQTQVRPELGFAFQHAMRAFVREDPDVILLGEIRDPETALEAIRASQTGHLVLSTLHCNDTIDAVQRLFDLDVHPNSIASELLAVFGQRLAKRICEGCRAPVAPDPAVSTEVFPDGVPEGFVCFAGRGCSRCGGHGSHGRIAVVEYLRTGPLVRGALARRAPVDELRALALLGGLATMRSSALRLVQDGVIAMTELPWILPVERMAPEPVPTPQRSPSSRARITPSSARSRAASSRSPGGSRARSISRKKHISWRT